MGGKNKEVATAPPFRYNGAVTTGREPRHVPDHDPAGGRRACARRRHDRHQRIFVAGQSLAPSGRAGRAPRRKRPSERTDPLLRVRLRRMGRAAVRRSVYCGGRGQKHRGGAFHEYAGGAADDQREQNRGVQHAARRDGADAARSGGTAAGGVYPGGAQSLCRPEARGARPQRAVQGDLGEAGRGGRGGAALLPRAQIRRGVYPRHGRGPQRQHHL